MGSGQLSNAERRDMDVPVTFFYEQGTRPESLLTSTSRARYTTTLPAGTRVYDLGEDPEDMQRFTQGRYELYKGGPQRVFIPGTRSDMYAAIRDAGHAGFRNTRSSLPNVVALFGKTPVTEDLSWRH